MPVHFHGHNDFGLATAFAVAAVRGGATWIQGTINGMGERAGNADIAEVALLCNVCTTCLSNSIWRESARCRNCAQASRIQLEDGSR